MFRVILLAVTLFFAGLSYGEETGQPLPAAQAFKFSTTMEADNQLVLHWDIGADYYLYRDKLQFSTQPAAALNANAIVLPEGHKKHDEVRGNYVVYTGLLTIPLTLQSVSQDTDTVKVDVKYQGCSIKGFCYPPVTEHVTVNVGQHAVCYRTSASLSETCVNKLLGTQHYWSIILGFLGLGLLLAFTPCVLPMIPILSGIIVGQGKKISTRKSFFLSLAYVSGLALAYAGAGMAVALAGGSIQAELQKPWMIELFSALFVLLSLSLFGWYELRLPNKMQGWLIKHSNKQKGGTYVGVFLMGAISTLIVSPCVSAPLVGVLGYIANTGDIVLGGAALLALGVGMGIPILIVGTSAGKFLPKTGAWMDVIKQLFGLMMLGLAVWMLARVWPARIIIILWAFLAIFAAMLLWRFRASHRHWRKVNQALGIAFLAYGLILLAGSWLGNTNPWAPLDGVSKKLVSRKSDFILIKNMQDFENQLLRAKQKNKAVILDFYADWCTSCIIMDRNVFDKGDVKRALQKYVLLRADVTQNNEFDKALMKRFNVIAPPTILFFDVNSKEIPQQHIVGEASATEFLANLRRVQFNLCTEDVRYC
ncbi:MAG: protein-disulfide reductase DsbD [Gammaproteobacteria bacterium]|nr:protein-disulfide reductase DsbD [Gammaproteobacteria bacterium]